MPFTKGHKLATGGKREGAGRKSNEVQQLNKSKAAGYIEKIEALAEDADSDKTRLAALIYLTDRRLGKPKQKIDAKVEVGVRVSNDLV